jgi:MFS family permease
MNLSYTAAGLLATANLIAYLLGALAAGLIVPRAPLKVLFPASLLAAGGSLCLLAAPSYPLLLIVMAILGVASATTWISTVTLLNTWTRPAERGVLLSMASIGGGWGVAVVAAMDVLAIAWFGGSAWHAVWLCGGAASLAIGGAALLALRSVTDQRGHISVPVPRIWLDLRLRSVRTVALVYALFGLGYSSFLAFFVAFLQRQIHVAGSLLVWACLGIAAGLGGIVVGQLSDRWGRRPTLVASMVLSALAAGLPILSTSTAVLLIAAILFGLPMVGLGSVVASYLGDLFADPGRSGRAFAVATVLFGIGQAGGPVIAGSLLDATGTFSAPFVLATAALMASTVVSMTLPRTELVDS